eukprot:1134675-Amphidinium_carterae.1
MYAQSSVGPRASVASTVTAVLDAWFGNATWLPVTVDVVNALAAALKNAGFRSVAVYIGMLKDMHVAKGHAWTDELTRAARLARRSAERGIGPARQSAPLPLQLLADVEVADDALCEGAPIGGWRFFVAGSFFLLRE